MASDTLKVTRKDMEEIAKSAEHYKDDDPEMTMFDADADPERLLATLAQKVLDGKIGKLPD